MVDVSYPQTSNPTPWWEEQPVQFFWNKIESSNMAWEVH